MKDGTCVTASTYIVKGDSCKAVKGFIRFRMYVLVYGEKVTVS